jgi:eukaryotic-like serine/threonine-protein kinase
LTPERWHQIRQTLVETIDRTLVDRLGWPTQARSDDPELKAEVESFLAHEDRPEGFIAEPAPAPGHKAPERHGDRLGPYRLVRPLGEGGMGVVYLAERVEEFEQRVALKVIRRGRTTSQTLHRFHAERQILARLEHPNIARLLDGGTSEEGVPYFAMELIEGERIDTYCDRNRLDTRRRLELFLSVCSALAAAHQSLIVHRDLKPGNILVDAAGIPKLLDFGIAKRLPGASAGELSATAPLQIVLTLNYASPEQLLDEPVGTASDLYSLGVVLYQVLTGRLPYHPGNTNSVQQIRAVCEEEPLPPSVAVLRKETVRALGEPQLLTPETVAATRDGDPRTLSRRLAGDVDSIVLKALRKDPRQRYASAEQLAADIRRHLDGLPVSARQGTLVYRAGKFVKRHRLGLAAAAALLVLAGGFTIAQMRQLRATERARDRAERVSAFLTNLFQGAAPNQPKGEEPTLRQLLDRGREKLEEGLQQEPETRATLLRTLGEVYNGLGDYAKARGLLEEVLALQRRLHSGDHPDLAAALNNLATVYISTGDTRRAESLLQQCIAMRRRLGDKEDLITPMNNLASLLLVRGDFAAGERIYREGLALRRSALGPRHPDVATSLRGLAVALYTAGNLDAAEPLLREALAIRSEAFGPKSPSVAATLASLGRVAQARGRLEEAERLYQETLEIRRAKLGEEHLYTALTKKDLASVLLDEREVATAGVLITQALSTLYSVRVSPEDDWNVAEAEGILGRYLAARGRLAEAEVCLRESYHGLEQSRGPRAIYTRTAARRLADLYQATGRAGLAAELRR